MEVKKQLNVSKEELNAFIKSMVLQDIKNATGKNVKESDIGTGYKYHKKLKGRTGKEGKVCTRIDTLTSGCYRASFESAQGINYLAYNYESDGEDKVNVCYEEGFNSSSNAKDLNHRLMSFLYKRSNKKRINLMLTHIEKLIQENRKPV